MIRFLKKHKKLLKNSSIVLLAGGILLSSIILLWISTFKIPTLESFEERKVTESTKIYDRTGEVLLYDVFKNIKRTVIPFNEISVNIKNATIAIEDTEFYNHKGVRPLATFRAVFIQPLRGKGVQGGSTITQQVIKNSVLTQEKKISRKIKEWVLAVRLEQVLNKDQILNIYLNETPYGGSIYGVEEASQRFFEKSAREVSVAEAAYLAALPQAPTFYSPYGNNFEALENRKNLVLSRMLQEGFIDQEDYDVAVNEVVEFATQSNQGIKAPHFVIYVREILTEKYGEDLVENGGLSVKTTLDWEMQQVAEELVKKHALENKNKFDAENASLVSIDPKNGEILSLVGSRDYFDEEIDGNFNIALAKRQPGSAFKPFAYAKAFEKGYTPETILFDLKTQFSTACTPNNLSSSGDCYSPSNYTGTFRGPISMREALAQSVNVPAIKTLYLAGVRSTMELAQDMGIGTLTDPDRYGLTLVLGGGEVRLLDMVGAYGGFANEGLVFDPTPILEIKDRDGNTLEKHDPQEKRVLDQNVAYQISDVLSDNVARSPVFGANSYLNISTQDVAAKTGTTNDYRDAWIIGYTPNLVTGVWAGNNDNHSMSNQSSSVIAAPLWREFMQSVLPNRVVESFPNPDQDDDDLKPVLSGVWNKGGVHSILHWVQKDDPRGEVPRNPESDPQYRSWEYSVRSWVNTQNIPEEASSEENKPKLFFSLPNEFGLNDEVVITPEIQSLVGIDRVDYYINSRKIGSNSSSPFSISFVPNDIENISSTNTIRVVVYDKSGNKTEDTKSFSTN